MRDGGPAGPEGTSADGAHGDDQHSDDQHSDDQHGDDQHGDPGDVTRAGPGELLGDLRRPA